MTTARELVTKAWQAIARLDSETFLDCFADDATWNLPGDMPHSGLKRGKAAIRGFVTGGQSRFRAGLLQEIRRVYADGDMVILESVGHGVTQAGVAFENDYGFVCEVEGGRIRHVSQYLVTDRIMRIVVRG